MTKEQAYLDLVQKRKACSRCQGLLNASQCCGGAYDADEIGAWSRWQGNLDAALMVIGQDWGDEGSFVTQKGRESPKSPTNDTLVKLLKAAGVEVSPPGAQKTDRGRTFFTNAILCLKTHGGLQGPVQREWFENCSSGFLLPLIQLVRPKLVVTLGEHPYRAVAKMFGLARLAFPDAVDHPEGFLIGEARLFPRYHCGRRILNTHRNMERQTADWQRIAPFVAGAQS